jgi:hypothetical protein
MYIWNAGTEWEGNTKVRLRKNIRCGCNQLWIPLSLAVPDCMVLPLEGANCTEGNICQCGLRTDWHKTDICGQFGQPTLRSRLYVSHDRQLTASFYLVNWFLRLLTPWSTATSDTPIAFILYARNLHLPLLYFYIKSADSPVCRNM